MNKTANKHTVFFCRPAAADHEQMSLLRVSSGTRSAVEQ